MKILLLCTLIFHAGSSPSLSSAASHLSNTQLLSVCHPYVPVRTAVNHIGTVFPVVKLASIDPGHARSQFGLVHWEDAEPGSFAHGVNHPSAPSLARLQSAMDTSCMDNWANLLTAASSYSNDYSEQQLAVTLVRSLPPICLVWPSYTFKKESIYNMFFRLM